MFRVRLGVKFRVRVILKSPIIKNILLTIDGNDAGKQIVKHWQV